MEQKKEDLPLILTAKDISEILHVSMSTVYEMMRRTDFPLLPIPGRVRKVTRDAFFDWMENTSKDRINQARPNVKIVQTDTELIQIEQHEHRPKIIPPSEKTMKQYFQFIADSDIPEKVMAKREAERNKKEVGYSIYSNKNKQR
jgi:hypothetical protein